MQLKTNRDRWPLAISVVALAVALSQGNPHLRVGYAADTNVTTTQKQTLLNLQDAFTSIADSVQPAVVGIHVEPAETKQQAKAMAPDDSGDDTGDVPDREFNPFGGLPFDFNPFGGSPQGRNGAPTPTPRRGASTGSGVIIKKEGNDFYVLTNYHVVEGGGKIHVQLSGLRTQAHGTLVGRDEKTDLAVVKIHLTGEQAQRKPAQFGNSSDVKVGQWAIAIGNPLDVGQTLTVGVISAKGRSIGRIGNSFADYSDMIQTDASINPGNSGGALVDINGNLIGINTAIASNPLSRGSIGIGFALPSNVAREVADQIIQHGEVVRGWLGVVDSTGNQEGDLQPELAKMFGATHGAFVDSVWPGSPASKAGIQDEDVITDWGNTPIHSFRELSQVVGNTPPGQDVPVKVIRDGKPMSVTVHTEKRDSEENLQKQGANRANRPPSEDAPEAVPTAKAHGLTVRALAGPERQSVGAAGVVVTDVEEGTSEANKIAPGMVIHRVNQTVVRTTADFKAAMAKVGDSDSYVLRVSTPAGGGAWTAMTVVIDAED